MRRIAAAYDRGNRSFSENWLENFKATFTALGGEIIATIGFKTDEGRTFLETARELLATEPDGVLIVANSMDSAVLCQQIRKIDPSIPITLADWGATERQLVALANFLETQGSHPASELTALLDAQCGNGEIFETIYIASNRDDVISSVGLARLRRSKREDLLGMDLSGRSFLNTARHPGKAAWSETFLSTVSSQLTVALTVPLPRNVVIGEITLDRLSVVGSRRPAADRRLSHRKRPHAPEGRQSGGEGHGHGGNHRSGQSHHAYRQGRPGISNCRQRCAHTPNRRTYRGSGAGVSGCHRGVCPGTKDP